MSKSKETFFGSQCMFICDQVSLRILDVNEVAVHKIGLPRESILGKKLGDLGEEVSDAVPDYVVKSGSGHLWKFNSSEEDFFVQFSSHFINYEGSPAKLIVAHTASPKDHLVEKELSAPVEFSNFPMAEIEWNKNLEVLRWSRKAEELFGWTQEEAINHKNLLKEFVYPEDLPAVRDQLSKTIKAQVKKASIVNRNFTKDGEIIYCEWYNSLLFDEKGNLVSLYSLVVNVTDRINALQHSHRGIQSYKDLFDSINDAIYLINDEGIILDANRGTASTFGYDVEELIGQHYKLLSAPGKFDGEKFFEMSKKNINKKASTKYEGWGRRANGEVFPTELFISTGTYFEENVLIIIERDVSEWKLAEEELKQRENLLSELFNTTPLGIALLNIHNEVIEVNKGFENLFGYSNDEISGLELDRVIVPEEYMEHALHLTKTPHVEEEVTRRKNKNGDLIDVIIYGVPIIVDQKMVFKYGIYVDISDRKKAEEGLRSSLKEKEVLLAEIHHRVKNNLAVITGLLELQSYSTESESARSVLKASQMRIHSIALVHEKLYDNDDFSEIKVQEYIKELAYTVEQTMLVDSKSVDLSFDLEDIGLPITHAIPCGLLLNEVLTNSFKHAFVDRDKGEVTISFKQEDNMLVFKIQDNGIGIDTKQVESDKTSLGMKLITTLAKQINAEMTVKSENGTSIEFRFSKEKAGKL